MKTTFYLFISLAVLSACTKDVNPIEEKGQGVLDPASFSKFLEEKTDGVFSLTNSTTVAMQTGDFAEVNGGFTNQEELKATNTTESFASIGGIDVFNTDKNGLKSSNAADKLFGSKVEFIISKSGSLKSNRIDAVIDSMYVPYKLLLTHPELDFENDKIAPGTTFEWNEDPLNDQGVVFTLIYEAYNNSEEIQITNPKDFVRTEIVVDNGKHVLTNALFKDVPEGAYLSLVITRGNYKFASATETESDDIFSLYAYTAVEFGARFIK
ncbi:hypothetical protein [Carboxylicivirga sp. RSCT41]|uniref:hypothetical protein n=1 Tax=Carboxylicivirga agarovorans TaxID=3417570 RepID=UPI003D347F58